MPVYQPQLAYSPVKTGHPDMKFGQSVTAADLGPIILHLDHNTRFSFTYFATRSTLKTVPLRYFAAASPRVLASNASASKRSNGLLRVTSSISLHSGVSHGKKQHRSTQILYSQKQRAIPRRLRYTGLWNRLVAREIRMEQFIFGVRGHFEESSGKQRHLFQSIKSQHCGSKK
jgi:hypothetical protein